MNSGRVLDLDALLAPISDAAPSGIDLREETSAQSDYYRMKDFRSVARATERRNDAGEETDGAQAEWRQLFDLTQLALREQSKDLEVACWLVEALVRRNGFAGLCDGFALLQGLFRAFPENLHSLQDEDGLETFLAPLTGLNGLDGEGTLIQPIRKVTVTAGGDQAFAFFHYAQAEDLERLTDDAAKERRSAAGVPTIQKFDEALRASPKDFLRAVIADIRDSLAALDNLTNSLSDKYGKDAPPTSRIRETLESIQDVVRSRTKDILPPEISAETSGDGVGATGGELPAQGTNGAAAPIPSAINNREEALRALSKISEFFKATEPHSTIAFTLEDVVRRARMSLPELLAELLPDETARRTFLTSAGIRPPSSPS